MELLIKFEYNNKWYYVEKDSFFIRAFINENGRKNYNLTKEEIDLVKKILYELTPSKERIKVTDFKYKGNTYQILVDPKTQLLFFDPTPNEKDLYELNMMFNNREPYLASEQESKIEDSEKASIEKTQKENILYKRVIKILNVFAVVNILSASLISYLNPYFVEEIEGNIVEQQRSPDKAYSQSLSNEEFIKKVHEAVNKNESINEKEKEFINKSLTDQLLIDNKNYIQFNKYCNTLQTLRIYYKDREKNEEELDGTYSIYGNYITFYDTTNIEEVNPKTGEHELFHAFNRDANSSSFFTETINTIFQEEYGEAYDETYYQRYLRFTKALMEIVGEEPFRKYQHGQNSSYNIFRALEEITGNKKDAYVLINLLDLIKKTDEKVRHSVNPEEKKEYLDNLSNMVKQACEKIGEYYKAKYNEDYKDNPIMKELLDVKINEYGITSPERNINSITTTRHYFNKSNASLLEAGNPVELKDCLESGFITIDKYDEQNFKNQEYSYDELASLAKEDSNVFSKNYYDKYEVTRLKNGNLLKIGYHLTKDNKIVLIPEIIKNYEACVTGSYKYEESDEEIQFKNEEIPRCNKTHFEYLDGSVVDILSNGTILRKEKNGEECIYPLGKGNTLSVFENGFIRVDGLDAGIRCIYPDGRMDNKQKYIVTNEDGISYNYVETICSTGERIYTGTDATMTKVDKNGNHIVGRKGAIVSDWIDKENKIIGTVERANSYDIKWRYPDGKIAMHSNGYFCSIYDHRKEDGYNVVEITYENGIVETTKSNDDGIINNTIIKYPNGRHLEINRNDGLHVFDENNQEILFINEDEYLIEAFDPFLGEVVWFDKNEDGKTKEPQRMHTLCYGKKLTNYIDREVKNYSIIDSSNYDFHK